MQLLDGINSVVGGLFQTDLVAADIMAANMTSGTFPTSAFNSSSTSDAWACMATRMSLRIQRAMLIRNTFCNNGWVGRTPSYKDLQGTLDGFMSKKSKISDPLYLFAAAGAIPAVATFDTGCTMSFLFHASDNSFGVGAVDNSSQSISFMADGTYIAPMSVWVTT